MVLFAILYLLLFLYVKTKYDKLFCFSQILQFVLYSWSVRQGSSPQRTLKICGGHPFIPEEQSSLGSASLGLLVTPWHIFMFSYLKACS